MQTTTHEHVSPARPASPQAVRLRRPGWRDPRLLLGILLVAGSVALGSGLVAAAGRTVAVYAADGPLVAGEPVEPGRLEVHQVRLADAGQTYLEAGRELPAGLLAVRTVGDGELVPLSALGTAEDLAVRPVAISASGDLSSGITEGSTVDLWFVPDVDASVGVGGDQGAVPSPSQLAAELTVSEVVEPEGALAVGSSVTVQVLVPLEQLSDVLAALAAPGSVEVIHVPGRVTQP